VRYGDSAGNANYAHSYIDLTFEGVKSTDYAIEAHIQVIGRWK
jgi:hypothetical protein